MVSLNVRANPCAKLHSLSPLSFPNIYCSHILVNATHTQKCVYQAILNNKKVLFAQKKHHINISYLISQPFSKYRQHEFMAMQKKVKFLN